MPTHSYTDEPIRGARLLFAWGGLLGLSYAIMGTLAFAFYRALVLWTG